MLLIYSLSTILILIWPQFDTHRSRVQLRKCLQAMITCNNGMPNTEVSEICLGSSRQMKEKLSQHYVF